MLLVLLSKDTVLQQ